MNKARHSDSQSQNLSICSSQPPHKQNAQPENRNRASASTNNLQLTTSNSLHLPPEMSSVLRLVIRPLLRQIVRRINRGNRAHWNARAAINALHRIDEQLVRIRKPSLILLRVNTVHRASIHTSRVLSSDTWFRNHICHLAISLNFLRERPRRYKSAPGVLRPQF